MFADSWFCAKCHSLNERRVRRCTTCGAVRTELDTGATNVQTFAATGSDPYAGGLERPQEPSPSPDVPQQAHSAAFCDRCGTPRSGPFCAACGTRLAGPSAPTRGRLSRRTFYVLVGALVVALGGIALGAIYILNGAPTTPGSIALGPDRLSCSDPPSQVVLTVQLPTYVASVIWEVHRDGVNGPLITSNTQSPPMLDYYNVAPGQWRQVVSGVEEAGAQCLQGTGRYGIVLRDVNSGTLLAATDYTIAP